MSNLAMWKGLTGMLVAICGGCVAYTACQRGNEALVLAEMRRIEAEEAIAQTQQQQRPTSTKVSTKPSPTT